MDVPHTFYSSECSVLHVIMTPEQDHRQETPVIGWREGGGEVVDAGSSDPLKAIR